MMYYNLVTHIPFHMCRYPHQRSHHSLSYCILCMGMNVPIGAIYESYEMFSEAYQCYSRGLYSIGCPLLGSKSYRDREDHDGDDEKDDHDNDDDPDFPSGDYGTICTISHTHKHRLLRC
jgi:hypothetical protein